MCLYCVSSHCLLCKSTNVCAENGDFSADNAILCKACYGKFTSTSPPREILSKQLHDRMQVVKKTTKSHIVGGLKEIINLDNKFYQALKTIDTSELTQHKERCQKLEEILTSDITDINYYENLQGSHDIHTLGVIFQCGGRIVIWVDNLVESDEYEMGYQVDFYIDDQHEEFTGNGEVFRNKTLREFFHLDEWIKLKELSELY